MCIRDRESQALSSNLSSLTSSKNDLESQLADARARIVEVEQKRDAEIVSSRDSIKKLERELTLARKHNEVSVNPAIAEMRAKYMKSETALIAVEAKVSSLNCLLYTSPSPRDLSTSRMPSSA